MNEEVYMDITLCSPVKGEKVSLLTDAQRVFLRDGFCVQADDDLDWMNLKRKGTEHSYPAPVRFSWSVEGSHDDLRLIISTDEAFTNPREIECPSASCSVDVYNLRAGQRYFWKIVASTPKMKSVVNDFWTLDEAPTMYRVEGLTNVRDLGGWKTLSGKHVKRGLVFRGSEMDTHHHITDEGRRVMLEELGVHTDLDLREEAVGIIDRSPLGPSVRFELIPVKAYGEYLEPEQNSACRKVFDLLADETAYPIYVHCWGGADRVGTVILLLNAMLGVDDESLLKDYELTSFAVWGERSRTSPLFKTLSYALDRYGSANQTLSDKATNYLIAAGVSIEQQEKIRSFILE